MARKARKRGRAAPRVDPAHPRTADLARLDALADLMDSRFRVPILGWRFGLDGILGLVPGIGDVAALGPSAYLVWQARKLGASNATIGRMAANTAVDFAVGGIPVIGDIFDVAFKANRRNIALLRAEIEGASAAKRPSRGPRP